MRRLIADRRTGCIVDNQLVVLDRRASRYWLASDNGEAFAHVPAPPPDRTVLLSWPGDTPFRRDTARQHWIVRARTEAQVGELRPRMDAVCQLRYLEWKCRRDMHKGGLEAGLRLLDSVSTRKNRPEATPMLVSAARRARRLWSSRDQCLSRSIALVCALRSTGTTADLVIGVALNPFAAHAWVQHKDEVLNDPLDHVLLFTPILLA